MTTRAAHANAAAAGRYLNTPWLAAIGEARAASRTEGGDGLNNLTIVESINAHQHRLPSTRPINQRWDRSRGIILASNRRPSRADLVLGSRNGVFTGESRRSYALRKLGSARAPPKPLSPTVDSFQSTPRASSAVKSPNNIPVVASNAGDLDQLEELARQKRVVEEGLEKERKRTRELLRDREQLRGQLETESAAVEKKLKELQAAHDAALEDAQAAGRRSAQQDIKRAQEELAVKARYVKELAKQKEQLGEEVDSLDTRITAMEKEHDRQLETQREGLERKRRDEVKEVRRSLLARKAERSTYETYRKVFDDFNLVLSGRGGLSDAVVAIENTLLAGSRFVKSLPRISDEMKRKDPWFLDKHPELAKRLDSFVQEHQQQAESAGLTLRAMRKDQQKLELLFRRAAHHSRTTTRHHYMSGHVSKMETTDMVHYVANYQPFSDRRDDIHAEIEQLQARIKTEKNPALAEKLKQEMKDLRMSRSNLSKIIAAHNKLRDVESLKALLSDSIEAKEVFALTVDPVAQHEEVLSAWSEFVDENPFTEEGSSLSASQQRMLRREIDVKKRRFREQQRQLSEVVMKRSILDQAMGKVTQQRMKELDKLIQERMRVKKVDERRTFEQLGVKKVGSSSFARPAPLKATASAAGATSTIASNTRAARLQARKTVRKGASPSLPLRLETVRRELSSNSKLTAQQRSELGHDFRDLQVQFYKVQMKAKEHQLERTIKDAGPDSPSLKNIQHEIDNYKKLIAEPESVKVPILGQVSKTAAQASRRAARRAEKSRNQTGAQVSSEGNKAETINIESVRAKLGSFARTAPMQAEHHMQLRPTRFHRFYLHGHRYASTVACQQHRLEQPDSAVDWDPSEQTIALQSARPAAAANKMDLSKAFSKLNVSGTPSQSIPGASESLHTDANGVSPSSSYRASEPTSSPTTDLDGDPSDTDIDGGSQHSHATSSADDGGDGGTTNLTYQISAQDFRTAAITSKNSDAAYWSYKLYKNPKGAHPAIHYCKKYETAQEQAKRFLDEPVLGFDIEWDPQASYGKKTGIKDNVSLIQLACEDKIALFQLATFVGDGADQLMPPALRQILESDKIIKCGVNVIGDARRIEKYLGVQMKGLFELSHLYRVVTYGSSDPSQVNKKLKNLAAQVQEVLLLPLKKDEVRTSAWQRSLTPQQISYSASDAYAGFRLFHELEAKRKLMSPMPPRPASYEEHQPLVLGNGTMLVPKKRSKPKAAASADGAAAEEGDEEEGDVYYDAVEYPDTFDLGAATAGATASTEEVTYPTLPPMDKLSIADAAQETQLQEPPAHKEPVHEETVQEKPTPTSRALLASPEAEAANSWLTTYLASLPADKQPSCGKSALRVWHMWHEQRHDLPTVAALARSQPLELTTVASYVLEAIKRDGMEYDVARVRAALNLLPRSVMYRYKGIVDAVKKEEEDTRNA